MEKTLDRWREKRFEEYKAEVSGWDWPGIVADIRKAEVGDDGTRAVYLGSVLSLYPSGKYYTAWACGNVTRVEAEKDNVFAEALDSVADSHGCFVFSGDADPCDVFVGMDA